MTIEIRGICMCQNSVNQEVRQVHKNERNAHSRQRGLLCECLDTECQSTIHERHLIHIICIKPGSQYNVKVTVLF